MRITVRVASRALLVLLALIALDANAEYYVVPTDDNLIAEADAIIVAKVTGLFSEFAGSRIVTNIDMQPELVLKGDVDRDAPIRIVEPGGIVGSRLMMVSAAPSYWTDNRALIFLTKNEEGQWVTYGAGLGKMDFVTDARGRKLAIRWAKREAPSLWTPEGQPHHEKMRDAAKFTAYIERFVRDMHGPETLNAPGETRDESAAADYFVEDMPAEGISAPEGWSPVATGTYPPTAYTLDPFRWDDFDTGGSVTFRISGSQPGHDSVGTAQRSLAAWTNDAGSNVRYLYGGTSTRGFVEDGFNTIVYNSPTGVPAGAIAYAQWFADDTHEYKNIQFFSISEGDVVVRSNLSASAKLLDEAVTHELGHTLGFRHSDQGTPSSNAAVMRSSLAGTYGAVLQPWDIEAVRAVYESTAADEPPPPPVNVVATATTETSVTITWSPAAGATEYVVERSFNGGPFVQVGNPTGTSFVNSPLTPGTTYVYRVRAQNTGGLSDPSNRDHATTILFADDPILPEVTEVRAIHLTELRQAVNAMRESAGLPAETWTDPSPASATILATHIIELRQALTPALTALGKPSPAYTDTLVPGETLVRAVHFQELRDLVK